MGSNGRIILVVVAERYTRGGIRACMEVYGMSGDRAQLRAEVSLLE